MPPTEGTPSRLPLAPPQNLIILLSLSPATQPLAPVLARMLLKLYCAAVVPVSLWVSLFASWLGVQVAV